MNVLWIVLAALGAAVIGFLIGTLRTTRRTEGLRVKLEATRAFASTAKNPNTQFAYSFAAGYIDLKQKNYAKAAEHFAKANPQDPYVWYYQALAYEGAGDTKSAAAYRKIGDHHQLDATGYAIVRPLAMAKVKK